MEPAVSMQTPGELMVVFSDAVSAGFAALQGPVNGVFGLMIALVVALTGIQWALSSNREVLAAGFGKVLLIGFFAWLINDWERLSLMIQAGFVDLGLAAGGGGLSRSDFLNPGAILQAGWRIVKALGDTPVPINNPLDLIGGLTDALILGLAMIGVMLAFAVLALQVIVTLLEFKIVTLGGFVLLPFGIWSKSAFLAERPLGFVVSSGLKTLALAIVISGAQAVFDRLQPSASPDMYEALAILAAALLLAMLAIFIPNLTAALVTGGPALGAGAAVTGALAVGGVTALAGAAGAGVLAGRSGIAGASRAAAGAGSGRATGSPSGSAWRPPPPPSAGPASGGGSPRPSPSGGGAAGPAGPSPARGPASGPATLAGEEKSASAQRRPSDRGAAEAQQARADFHKAAAGEADETPASQARAARRSAALQAFFVANAGRSLLPASETSGAVSPALKPEEP